MGWIDLVRDIQFANQIQSIAVTVTRPAPNDDPITTRGIWCTPNTEPMPGGVEFSRREAIRILALRRDDVPTAPKDTVILAPHPEDLGGDPVGWVVDGTDLRAVDHHRVIVRRATEYDT